MTVSLALALGATGLALVSGLPALALRRRAVLGDRLALALALTAGVVGVVAAMLAMVDGGGELRAAWSLPGASLALGIDGLSAFFLVPVFAVPALAALYAGGYQSPGSAAGVHLRVFLGVLCAGMALLVLARNGVLFLVGWELMAIAAFLLIATGHRGAETRRAAWIYLVATHLCTLALLAAIVLLGAGQDSLDWQPDTGRTLPAGHAVAVFALATIGFGSKAGLMPLHVWLPAAHANAPSHVSAVLSGVLIKMGAYGLLRFVSMLPELPIACAVVVMSLGIATAFCGVAATLSQGDLKRLLAYSSIENLGIVFCGIGLAMLGQALDRPAMIVLGLGGGLFHVWNHALFKPLLFLGAGAVVHATGTREIDRLGGLWRRLPRSGACFLIGCAAIAGLPLLNGFAGEFALYLGLFDAVLVPGPWVALLATTAIAALALVGGLALLAFVRCGATVWLGRPRSAEAANAHEAPASMTVPQIVLATGCLALGLLPWLAVPALDAAIASCCRRAPDQVPLPTIAALAPFRTLSTGALVCAAALIAVFAWLRARARAGAAHAPRVGTWDCGHVDASSPRLQYSGASFAQFATRVLGWAVRERRDEPAPLGLFVGPRRFARRALEPLLDGCFVPLCRRLAERCTQLRFLQRGKLHIYLLYILVTLVLLLAWATLAAPSRP